VGEVEAVRGRDVLLEVRALALDREEVEDAAAVVVEQDDHERQPEPARGHQPADVVGERDVADQEHGRDAGGGDAEGGRDGPVDPVGAAVGEHARRGVTGREEGLDVAHRHRGGDDERRLRRQANAQLRGHARLGEL
jgi:hypothetical protein